MCTVTDFACRRSDNPHEFSLYFSTNNAPEGYTPIIRTRRTGDALDVLCRIEKDDENAPKPVNSGKKFLKEVITIPEGVKYVFVFAQGWVNPLERFYV